MAAPMNWNQGNVRNPTNLNDIRQQQRQVEAPTLHRQQTPFSNRFPPRTPFQQYPIGLPQHYTPRSRFHSQGPRSGSVVDGQNINPSNTLVPNSFEDRQFHQNEHFVPQGNNQEIYRQGGPPLHRANVGNQTFSNEQNLSQFQNFSQLSSGDNGNHSWNFQPAVDNTVNIHQRSASISAGASYNDSVQYKNDQEQYMYKEDQDWIKTWLQGRCARRKDNLSTPTMKISEAQEKTRHMMVLLARLQKNKQILETLKHEDKSIWDQKLKEVLSVKSELESVQKELTCEENVKQLHAKVTQRKKKRERLRQRKQEMYIQQQEELAERERRSAEIDKSMQQLVEKQKLEKQELDMQKEADEILSQVRKKLAEANKAVQVVNSLQKLRKLRTDRLERQGVLHMYETHGHSSTTKLMFEAKMSNMTELLNKQLEVYKAEEAALQIHLETEHKETREKEKEKARLRMIEKQRLERKKEEKMLFGNQKDPVPGDPLYPFRQYYDSAANSFDALLAIRREWDNFLVTPEVGTCIPEDWVIPSEPASHIWESALHN